MHNFLHKLENTNGEAGLVRSTNCFDDGVN